MENPCVELDGTPREQLRTSYNVTFSPSVTWRSILWYSSGKISFFVRREERSRGFSLPVGAMNMISPIPSSVFLPQNRCWISNRKEWKKKKERWEKETKQAERKRTAQKNGAGRKKRSWMTHQPRSRVGSRQGQSGAKSTDLRTPCWLALLDGGCTMARYCIIRFRVRALTRVKTRNRNNQPMHRDINTWRGPEWKVIGL